VQEQTHLIQGPGGVLEVRLATPPNWQAAHPFVVIAHPHPLHGGSLNNKVVHTLAKTAYATGLASLRFNFRGVGQSTGEFAQGVGEQQDLLSVVHWMQHQYPQAPCWLAGFSFGGYVAAAAHAQAQARHLLLVAPAMNLFDVSQLQINSIPWLVIMDQQDEVVSSNLVQAWIDQQTTPPTVEWLDGVGHFFHGKLAILSDICQQAMQACLRA